MLRHIQLLPGEQITLVDGTVVSAVLHCPSVAQDLLRPGSATPIHHASGVVDKGLPDSGLGPQIEHPIDRATRIVGTQNAIAMMLGVTKGAVSLWKAPGNNVPAKHCPLIEEMTEGAVRCEDLRPDIRWNVLRAPPRFPDQAAEEAPNA